MDLNGAPVEDFLDELARVLPRSLRFPEIAEARVRCGSRATATDGFGPLEDRLTSRAETRDGTEIVLEVGYREERPAADHGPFLAEELAALDTVAELLKGHFERAIVSRSPAEGGAQRGQAPGALTLDRRIGVVNERVLDRMSDVFTALDADWRITYLNERARQAIVANLEEDLSKEELIGRHFWTVNPEAPEDVIAESELYEGCHEAMERQEMVAHEKYHEEKDLWVYTRVYPSESGVSIFSRDITEQKKYERMLEDSNERLEEFAYAASHDLQEPLRTVSNHLRFIEERYGDDLDADGREFLALAVDGADRMREMIHSLLEFSRLERRGGPFEPVDLNAVLEDVLEDIRVQIEESGAEITTDDLPRVEGDAGQLRRVFQNLLDNAIAYSGDGPPRIHVTAERAGEERRISVTDEGIGVDVAHADRIFDVFERLHTSEEHPGTGIGLAMCRRIVERHGGEIWVESEPGDGAVFTFTLPVAADAGA